MWHKTQETKTEINGRNTMSASFSSSPFATCAQLCVSTASSWKTALSTASVATQTEAFTTRDGYTQYPDISSCGVQTFARSASRADRVASYPDLPSFLTKALAVTEKEIQDSLADRRDWHAIRKLMPSRIQDAVSVHKIYPQLALASHVKERTAAGGEAENSEDFVPSAIEWNCSSSMLAVAFKSEKEHESWCSHESSLLFFSLYRSYDRDSIPSLTLPVPCISVMKSHPTVGTVYALGAYAGKILLVDTKDSKKNVFRTSSPDHLHHEHAVSQLQWISGGSGCDSALVSLGSDGRIFVWKLNLLDLHDFPPCQAYSVSIQDLPRTLISHSKTDRWRSEVGICDASFSYENENLFVIGCFGGAVLLCSLSQELDTPLNSIAAQDLNFETPVRMSYVPHRSTVNSVDFSPSERNLFFSCSTDGEIRVYNSLDTKPVALMHVESGTRSASFWSRERALIYCLTSRGTIRSIVLTREASDNSRLSYSRSRFQADDGEEISNLWLNYFNKSCEEFALLSATGELTVWRLQN